MHSGGRKLHQLMVIADCPLRSLANGGLYVRDEAKAVSPLQLLTIRSNQPVALQQIVNLRSLRQVPDQPRRWDLLAIPQFRCRL